MSFNLLRIFLKFCCTREWNYTIQQLNILVPQSIELGITSFDLADV